MRAFLHTSLFSLLACVIVSLFKVTFYFIFWRAEVLFSAFFPPVVEVKWTTLVSGQIAFHQDSKITASIHPLWMKS